MKALWNIFSLKNHDNKNKIKIKCFKVRHLFQGINKKLLISALIHIVLFTTSGYTCPSIRSRLLKLYPRRCHLSCLQPWDYISINASLWSAYCLQITQSNYTNIFFSSRTLYPSPRLGYHLYFIDWKMQTRKNQKKERLV